MFAISTHLDSTALKEKKNLSWYITLHTKPHYKCTAGFTIIYYNYLQAHFFLRILDLKILLVLNFAFCFECG